MKNMMYQELKKRQDLYQENDQELRKETERLEKSRKALINILKDVEDARRQAVEERDKTLAIINNFTDGLMVFDKSRKVVLANSKTEEIFGIAEKDLIGKEIKDFENISLLSSLPKLICRNNKIKAVKRAEFSLGKEIVIEITVVGLKKRKKEIGFLVIFHNISREKMVEKLKTEFVSIAAHQLRTPLSAIKWSLSLLQEEKMSENERKDLLTKVFRSNERMINLINDLLNVARIEEGRYLFELQKENIVEIVKKVIPLFSGGIKAKNIKFTFTVSEGKIPDVKIDKEKISLCIQNLLSNAVRYTKKGGRVTFSIKYNISKKEILFSIQDTGVGISENQQKRVFGKFFRGENVIKMETEGTGLGLFIAKNVVEAHKGKIWFKSKINKGTTFYFTIPVTQ